MDMKLHANATTTPRTRAYIQHSRLAISDLAEELGVSEVFARPAWDTAHLRPGKREPLVREQVAGSSKTVPRRHCQRGGAIGGHFVSARWLWTGPIGRPRRCRRR
jgi:hypothetical protein